MKITSTILALTNLEIHENIKMYVALMGRVSVSGRLGVNTPKNISLYADNKKSRTSRTSTASVPYNYNIIPTDAKSDHNFPFQVHPPKLTDE